MCVGDVQLREGLLQCVMTTKGPVMTHSQTGAYGGGAAQLVACSSSMHAVRVPSRARHKPSMRVNTCNNRSVGGGGVSRVSAPGRSRVHSESAAWAAGDLVLTKPNQAKT